MSLRKSVLLGVLAVSAASAQSRIGCGLLSGWHAEGAARAYTPDNLFEYKDGGAEGYLQYGFVNLQGASCSKDGVTLDLDLSEMSDADDAYGMLMANVDQSHPLEKLGMGAQITSQSLLAAKGKYYLELTESGAKADAQDAAFLRELGQKILATLEGSEAPPATLGWFVPEGLVQVRMVPESVLGLKQIPRGYVAKYKQGQAFIATQASVEDAKALMKTLNAKFSGTSAELGDEAFTASAKYLNGLCIFRKGKVVVGTANLVDPEAAFAAARQLVPRIP